MTAKKFRLPCVYEFIQAGVVLYVGRSDAGFSRAFRGYSNGVPQPSGRRRVQAFYDADQIRVTVFDSTIETQAEEQRLIRLYRPRYNSNLKAIQDSRIANSE